MLTVVRKSIDIKAPVDTVFTYFARPEHVSDQMSDKGVGMTVIPMDIKAGMGVGTTFRVIGDFSGCLLYTSPSPRDRTRSRMPSSA